MTPQQTQAFVHGANAPTGLVMSAAENARADTRHITGDMAASLGNNPNPISNKTFLNGFMSKLTPNERGAMIASDGALTAQGIQRVQNAVFAKAYGDSPTLERMSKSSDDNTKALSQAMKEAAPSMLRLQSAIESGQVDEAFDPRADINEAVGRISRMRDEGVNLNNYLAQQDAFNQIEPKVEGWMRAFYNEAGTRPASGKDVATFMKFYVDEAMRQPAQGLDLGAKVTPSQVLTGARERVRVEQGSAGQGQLGGLEPGRAGPSVGSNEAGGGPSGPSDTQPVLAQMGNGPDQAPAKAGQPRQGGVNKAKRAAPEGVAPQKGITQPTKAKITREEGYVPKGKRGKAAAQEAPADVESEPVAIGRRGRVHGDQSGDFGRRAPARPSRGACIRIWSRTSRITPTKPRRLSRR